MADFNPIITQRDLAMKLGVSNATISLALRDSPRIPEAKRREIQALAEAMGYRPNPAATALSHLKRLAGNIPIRASIAWLNLWPKPEEFKKVRLFEDYLTGASACAKKFGFRLEEIALAGSSARRILKILAARGVNGLVLSPQHYRHEVDLRDFLWGKFSAIRISRLPLEPALHLVTADQSGNTMLAIDHIMAKGYRRVGFINYGKSAGDRIWRFESGYLAIQQELTANDRLPVYRLDSPDAASRAGLGKWMKKFRPDAILTLHSDTREILEKLGYRAPDDIGLATVNIADCRIDAGIDQNAKEIGRCAILQLLSLLHNNERGIPDYMRETLIKGKWVDGASLQDRR